MEDERWTIKDKIEQFRGVTALFNSTYSNVKEKTHAQRKKLNREIKNLTSENKKFRQEYEEVLHGDKKNLLPVLHAHPKIHLAFKNLNPQEIEEELKQSIFCKNKELDRLRYKRKNLEEILLNKKLELAELEKEAEDVPENLLFEQEIANQIQSISVKLNAARTTRDVYEKAFKILEKDSIRFDEVLEGLRKDLLQQGESIVKAVEMGQNVSEELHGLQKDYKVTEKAVRDNMRQRDRAIRALKMELDSVRVHGHTSRQESRSGVPSNQIRQSGGGAAIIDEGSETNVHNVLEMHIKQELTTVEGYLNQIKEAAMVHKINEIYPRIEEQKRQKLRLEKQITENQEELDRMLELHNQLDVMLEVILYHTMTEEAIALKEERAQLRSDLEKENEKLKETKEELVRLGQKITNVRTALFTLNMMLDTVWPGFETEGSTVDFVSAESELMATPSIQLKPLTQPNTEALNLMEQVTKKVRWLLDVVKDKDLTQKKTTPTHFPALARTSNVLVEDEADNIVSDMLDELEDMDDPSVPTRKFIKSESQRIVDMYNDPKAMFDVPPIKYKKHKCF